MIANYTSLIAISSLLMVGAKDTACMNVAAIRERGNARTTTLTSKTETWLVVSDR
jgi:hypothetical protein